MAVDKNVFEKQQASKIANEYGFFPLDNMKVDPHESSTFVKWGFYANRSNRTNIHIKYNPIELDSE